MGQERISVPTALAPIWIKLVGVASRVYHSLKFDHLEAVNEAVMSGSFGIIQELVVCIARHYASEFDVKPP